MVRLLEKIEFKIYIIYYSYIIYHILYIIHIYYLCYSNNRGETFCEGLKWMCKLFEKNGQKDL